MKWWLVRCLVRGASLTREFRFSRRTRWQGLCASPVHVFVLSTLLLGSVGGIAASASAQLEPPFDLNPTTQEPAQLPRVPQDFIARQVQQVTLSYHPQTQAIAERLAAKLPGLLRKVADELRISPQQAVDVRVARGPREMARLAPVGAPPPDYAVGVAYPALGLVILSVVDPQSWFPPNLDHVLTHELSHVLLHRAVGGRPLPLWFVEGFAVHQAGEQRLGRIQTLWEAAVLDDVLSSHELSHHFPSRPNQVNLAYAESADLVEHLLRGERDRARLGELLIAVKAGQSFEQALLSAYHIDLPYLE
ncbi:MAG TPA: peptidase MA family metallohydrolase, partial [Polyangiales bacterium]